MDAEYSQPFMFRSPSFDLGWRPGEGTFRLESPGRSIEAILACEIVRDRRASIVTTDELSLSKVDSQVLEDAHGRTEEVHVIFSESQGVVLSARFRLYKNRPFMLFRLALENVGTESLQIRRFFFQTQPEGLQPVASPTGFYRVGWQSWSHAGFLPVGGREYHPIFLIRRLQGPMIQNALTPWVGKQSRFWSETVGAVITPQEALIAGGASLADQFVQVGADLRPSHQKLLVQSQADDIPLEAGEICTSEWFYVEWVALPNIDPLAQYAYAVARQAQVSNHRPVPTGWCSWYIFWNKVSEAAVVDNLATAALLADELPLQVLQLDEGYQTAWGDWMTRNERFPHSLEWLADRIKGSGFTPGLWLGPFTAHPRSRLAREHPEWLLRDKKGRPVSAGLISNARSRALDTTHPGFEDHLRHLIDTAVHEWGYPYLKLDFLYAAALPGQRYDPRLTRAQAYRRAMQVIRETAGEDTCLVGCGAPFGPSIGLVDAMRIGPDTAPRWLPSFMRLRRPLYDNPSLPSLRNSLRNVATCAWMHGRWWLNDPDTLLARSTQTSLTEDEVIAQATLLGLCGGLFILSDDLSKLSPERRTIAAAFLPPLIDGMDVVDLFQQEMPTLVVVPVIRSWGRWRLLGLFNWEDEPVQRTLPRNLPDFDHRQPYHLVDFWGQRYMRLEPGAALPDWELPPHSGLLLGMRPVKPGAHLVATTFHVSQGGEITAWNTSADEMSPDGTPLATLTLSISIERLARGEVWLALPCRPHSVIWNDEALPPEDTRAIAPGVWAISIWINGEGTLRVAWETT